MNRAAVMPEARFFAHDTALAGLRRVERSRVEDERGFLSRLYCKNELAGIGFDRDITQINHTLTYATGAVRGMHFQYAPHAEEKFVSCLRGEVFDVAVDLRGGSPTFLRWHGEHLSEENGISLFIPRGFAHGFQTLTNDCELLYLHTASYSKEAEGGVNPLDPALAIEWPLAVGEMSARDQHHSFIDDSFTGIDS